jgi:hypothetical protein
MDPERQEQRLGQILLARGLLDGEQLAHALERQRSEQRPLGELLVSLGLVSSAAVSDALAEQKGWGGGNLGFGGRLLRHLHVVPSEPEAPEPEPEAPAPEPALTPVVDEAPPEPDAAGPPAAAVPDEPPEAVPAPCKLFVPTPAGYRLQDWPGPPLGVGATVELGDGDAAVSFVVSKLVRSPLAGAKGRLAYLQPD